MFIKLQLMTLNHSIMYTVELKITIHKVPSQTDNIHGIRNSDWFVVLGGDGHQPATLVIQNVYAQWQQKLKSHNEQQEKI